MQDYQHISASLPLSQSENVRFLFGCETEMDKNFNLGISNASFDKFDFIVIPTTHFHMTGFTVEETIQTPIDKTRIWIERFNRVLDMDLPFHKIEIANLTCGLIDASRKNFLKTIDSIPKKTGKYFSVSG